MDNKSVKSAKPRRKHSSYYERTLAMLEKRKREIPNKTFRKHILDNQNKADYQNEYDRIKGYLSNKSILPPSTAEYLEQRKNFLKSVGARDIESINDFSKRKTHIVIID